MFQVIYNNLTGDAAAFQSKLFSWQYFIWDSSQIKSNTLTHSEIQ